MLERPHQKTPGDYVLTLDLFVSRGGHRISALGRKRSYKYPRAPQGYEFPLGPESGHGLYEIYPPHIPGKLSPVGHAQVQIGLTSRAA